MKVYFWFIGIAGLAYAADAQPPDKIGEVLSLQGKWCRQATVLKVQDSVFLSDSIRYCATPMTTSDGIVIRFFRKSEAPYDRPYKCSTPGICDKKEELWLEGAYIRIHSPSGGPLISSPRTVAVAPDYVLETGEHLTVPGLTAPNDGFAGTAGRGGGDTAAPTRPLVCRFDGVKVDSCSFDASDFGTKTPGLYGIFSTTDRDHPAALVGIVPSHSGAKSKWSGVPDAFKFDKSTDSVVERRLYLMDLLDKVRQ